MKQIISDLFPMNRCLMGEGYDNALLYLKHLIELGITVYPSGTQLETWTVPDEWVVKDAWVKYKGKKIIDHNKNPLSLVVGSLPFSGKVTREELCAHLHYSDDQPDAHPYVHKLYDKDWGVTMPKSKIYKDKKMILKEGEYEVFIDTEYRPGVMKIATHIIPGKTDREVLLFAHLDHPHQANNNLSGVAVLVDLVKHIKPQQLDHTIKLVFCPATIGSVAYALTEDTSMVDFMISVDMVGNLNPEGFLLQQSFNQKERINKCAYLALRGLGKGYRNGKFRSSIGSDEYVFNDPYLDTPGILITSHPYDEYHSSADTPDKIDETVLQDAQKFIIKTIEYYEKDFIPNREFVGPLHRNAYGLQTAGKQLNLSWDYFLYAMDGEKTFSELCFDFGLNFEYMLEHVQKLIDAGEVSSRPAPRKGEVEEIAGEEHNGLSGEANVPLERGEMS